jgi:hypothetical protein
MTAAIHRRRRRRPHVSLMQPLSTGRRCVRPFVSLCLSGRKVGRDPKLYGSSDFRPALPFLFNYARLYQVTHFEREVRPHIWTLANPGAVSMRNCVHSSVLTYL